MLTKKLVTNLIATSLILSKGSNAKGQIRYSIGPFGQDEHKERGNDLI